MRLALSRIHFPITTLGPGRRIGIWFQGCSIRCPGCISVDTWRVRDGDINVAATVEQIAPWLADCDGVTISGGEPFDQPDALLELLHAIRSRFETNILVYSGFPIEHLGSHLEAAQGLIDALISDPFLQDVTQTKTLRGSDNQRLHCLTPEGASLFSGYERPLSARDKQLDVMFDEEGTVWLAGIPSRHDMSRLRALLVERGHSAQTTDAPIKLCKTPR
jgi:anaerobic ribonucleoside-triphosphate reductase activating protein